MRVVPTRRLAHDLRSRIDAAHLATGIEVWRTTDILTWDELVASLFALERQAGRLSGRWLPASAVQIAWEQIVREDRDLPPLVSPSGVARAAALAWRRMHDYAIPMSALDRAETPEAKAFARWCERYSRRLMARGWIDAALAQYRVGPVAPGAGLQFVGFDRYTPAQEAAIERWIAAGAEIRREAAPLPRGRAVKVRCRDRGAEVEAAARWAAGLLDGGAARRVAIVVPDLARRREEVRRLVERVMSPAAGIAGGPSPHSHGFELAAARPLADQPVVAAALDCIDAFTGTPDNSTPGRLLRNPYIIGADTEGSARARLDAWLRRHQGAAAIDPARLAQLSAGRACPVFARSLTAAHAVIENWPRRAVPSTHVVSIFRLLESLGWSQGLPDSKEHQAGQRWHQLLTEFAGTDDVTGLASRTAAARLLRELAGRELFEPQEIRAPLLVIDVETCAGMHFDAAWVCGLDAAQWPPPVAPDPFLPITLQRRQGLPRASAELARREARETLDRLLRSAADVILSVPSSEDETPLLPSPMLADVDEGAAGDGWTEPRVAVALFQTRPALESLAGDRMPPLRPGEASRGGARLLELQSACPFRAQAEVRLGAVALDDPQLGVGAAERGDLVHSVLARLWRVLGDQAALHALDAAATSTLVQRVVAEALAVERRSADEVLAHLLDLEADWLAARALEILNLDRERDPFSVESIETPRTLRMGGLALEVRPDRVDRLLDGSLAIIDYKTGADADAQAWLHERPRLPQLPAYAQSFGHGQVAALAFARVRSGESGYAGLARHAPGIPGLRVVGERGGPPGYASWAQLQAEWRRRLDVLAAEYTTGDAQLAPDPPRACRHCHLGALCRIAGTRLAASAGDRDD